MNHSIHKEKITIIGAGLVGSLLAVLLAKRGYRIALYERRPDMRRTDISAGRSINLALANRGIYALQQAELMEKISPILTEMKGRMVHDIEGQLNFQSYGQKPEEVIYSVSRGELNKICLNAAEETGLVDIFFNQRCESVDFKNNQITFVDENTATQTLQQFSQIIGTDGSASAVREAIHQQTSQQHEIIPLGHSYKELRIPPGRNGEYLIEKNALHIWPRGGFMLIALPNADASFTVTLFMSNEGNISFENINSAESVKAFFDEYFTDILPLIPQLTKDFFSNPTGKLATVKCSPWHFKDKALLLGDAAHAIVPFHGQGMNCGFEDAWELIKSIEQHAGDFAKIFAQVNQNRKINGDAIADMAIENYITMRDSVRDKKFLLKNALAFELEKRFSGYFCPRYSMVMFHRLPYSEAKSRGIIQEAILNQLTESIQSIKQVDYALAEQLIKEKLSPVSLNPN
ncbi:FAD-dependent oxidoreductase [Aliikangiella maris]|uniref:NAD(P)/FAD-dependent oxidoreductase n=2 Tax=Aliikangiella maris TaxID=3162458 RepID=A0ABV2BTF6_9GAMM